MRGKVGRIAQGLHLRRKHRGRGSGKCFEGPQRSRGWGAKSGCSPRNASDKEKTASVSYVQRRKAREVHSTLAGARTPRLSRGIPSSLGGSASHHAAVNSSVMGGPWQTFARVLSLFMQLAATRHRSSPLQAERRPSLPVVFVVAHAVGAEVGGGTGVATVPAVLVGK